MNPSFYAKPVMFPIPGKHMDPEIQQGLNQFCRRAMELLRAAALIDGSEPGLLTQEDRDSARRRGANNAKRILSENKVTGKAHVAYYRTLTVKGFRPGNADISGLAQQIWILEDRCGLADCYLRGAADVALQKGVEAILCPSPIRRDRLEAIFLPSVGAALLSDRAADSIDYRQGRCVHLDRIPDAERKHAMRGAMRDNRKQINSLITRAANYLTDARILSEMETITCADGSERL